MEELQRDADHNFCRALRRCSDAEPQSDLSGLLRSAGTTSTCQYKRAGESCAVKSVMLIATDTFPPLEPDSLRSRMDISPPHSPAEGLDQEHKPLLSEAIVRLLHRGPGWRRAPGPTGCAGRLGACALLGQ